MGESGIIRPNSPRKQHVISKFYLEHFVDGKGKLFVYEAGKLLRKSVPSREATERDFFEYTTHREDSGFRIEEFLGRIEALAGPIHAKFISGSSILDKEETLAWAFFVASTFLRSRRIRNELSVKSLSNTDRDWMGTEHIRQVQYEVFMKYGRLESFDEIAQAAQKARDEFEIPGFRHAQAIRNSTPKLAYVLAQKHWQVVEARGHDFFATCDAPVLSFQLRGNALYDGYGWGMPNAHVALPLSPQIIFIASPPEIRWATRMDSQNSDLMNLVVARFADRYVFADRNSPELAGALDRHGKTMVFGENAFKVD